MMNQAVLKIDDVKREEEAVTDELATALGIPQGRESLKLTGMEFLGFLAAKIVIPITCGFVSRVLYDKYKDLKKTDVEAARQELTYTEIQPSEAVNESVLCEEVTNHLAAEGLPEPDARRIVKRTIERTRKLVSS